MLPGPSNAIVYAQFNLQGRWLRMLSIALIYAVLLGAAVWVTAIVAQPFDLRGWIAGLTALQIANLLLFGSFRVESAVRNDVTSRMLESHRLMPAAPLAGILGYIFGAPLLAFLIALGNIILGTICCAQSHLSVHNWLFANGVLFIFAIFIYSMVTQFSFIARGGFLLLIVAGAASMAATASEAMGLLPAIAVLFDPLLSRSNVFAQLFNAVRLNDQFAFGFLCGIAGQIAFTLIAIRAAVRRYTSPNITGISETLGLLMLLTWVVLILQQSAWPDSFSYRYRSSDYSSNDLVAQTVLAFSTSMLLALLPIGSAAWTARQAQRRGDPTAVKPSIARAEGFTTFAAVMIISALLILVPAQRPHMYIAGVWTMVIVVNFLLSMAALFSWGYLIRQRAWVFVFIWVMITWVTPVIIDAIYRTLLDNNADNATLLTAFSQPGALALIWSDSRVSVVPGILGQIALSAVPTSILLFTHARRRRFQSRAIQPMQ
jgi:hypothetical protein